MDVIVSETIKQTHRRKAKRSSKNETYRFARSTNRNTFWGENGILDIGRPLISKFIAIVKTKAHLVSLQFTPRTFNSVYIRYQVRLGKVNICKNNKFLEHFLLGMHIWFKSAFVN